MFDDDGRGTPVTHPKRPLVLLANAYPFGTWEPYLEPEVARLAECFDLSLYALSVRSDQRRTKRAVPAGVRVVPLPLHSLLFYALVGIVGLVNADLRKELLRAWRVPSGRMACLVYTAKIWTRAQWEARQIRRDLLQHGWSKDTAGVLYSYRMEYQAYLCYLLKRYFTNAQVVIRGHASDLEVEHRPGHYVPFREISFSQTARIVVISQYNLRYLAQRYPLFVDKIVVSYLGIEDCSEQKWTPDSRLRLVSVSHLGPTKRVDLMLAAVQQCAQLHPEITMSWKHYGSGEELQEYRRQATKLGPQVEAVFVGQVDHDDLIRNLSAGETDLFLSTSAREGLPVSMMESMSLGIPVISTPVAGVPEIVSDGVNGWLLDESAIVESLSAALWRYYTSDLHEKSAMRQAARHTWEQRFSAHAAYAHFIQMLDELYPKENV